MSDKRLAMYRNLLGKPPPEITRSEIKWPARDGTMIRALLLRPTNPPVGGSCLIVSYHGGGFCVGQPESEEFACRNYVMAFGTICFLPAYRLAPAHPFPQAAHDAFDALKFAAKHAKSWGAKPETGFVVAGSSAGGNLAAVVSLLARDAALSPPLTGQHLMIPILVGRHNIPDQYKPFIWSHEQNQFAPILPRAAIDMFMRGYRPDELDGERYAVLRHAKGYSNLPPTYFQICGLDPLRDEAIVYERVLREEYAIQTRLDLYPGVPHGFWGYMPTLRQSLQFRRDQIDGMAWLLGRKPDTSKVMIKAGNALT